VEFYLPKSHVVSFRLAELSGGEGGLERVSCEMLTWDSILRMLDVPRIQLLKMDIEGGEYGVLDSILGSKVLVEQLLVEFHHRMAPHRFEDTEAAIRKLRSRGYRLFHVSRRGLEYSFVLDR